MAERLTKKTVKTIQDKYSLGQYLYYDFAGLDDINKLLNKLGKLEDILEKYGIESVELLEHIIKKGIVINSTIEDFAKEEYDKIKQDRDTWKRACELACDVLRDINYKIYNEDRIDFENTFYQQAKKEGENNDTNN